MTNISNLFLLHDDVIFLNHGSFGACPKPVFQAYQDWQLKLEQQPVDFLHSSRSLNKRMAEVRDIVARSFGSEPENIVGVPNTTVGLNVIAQSLNLEAGDEIVTSDHEYSALYKTWQYVSEKQGAVVVEAKIPLPLISESAFTQAVLSKFTEKTKVLFLSHITSETSLIFPIQNIIKQAKNRGIITIIDGAHVPGHIPLNLNELGADFYVGNCHKWLMAPKSSAFLYAAPPMQKLIDPLVISHGWTHEAKAEGALGAFGNAPFIDGIEMQGTMDPSAWFSVPAALAFQKENNWQSVARDCQQLAQDTAHRVRELTGLPTFSSPGFCAPQMVSMPVPDHDPVELNKQMLAQFGIEIPVINWRGQTIVRLSVQGYNTHQQMDALVGAIEQVLKQ